jgi:hypothetical protein
MQATGFLKGKDNFWADLAELANAHDQFVSDPGNWPTFPEDTDLSGRDPEPFYVRRADGRYADISSRVGFDGEYNARGLAVADVDQDGDPDLALANQWEDSWFFRNDRAAGRSLGLTLLLESGATETLVTAGARSGVGGSPAIGALATVTTADAQLRADVERIWAAQGLTAVLITHDIDEALLLADRVIVLGGSPASIRLDLRIPLPRAREPGGADWLGLRRDVLGCWAGPS